MASTTTNIGLTKPAGTDQALISAINGNMDIIDTKMGAVGNTSVQSQITSLSDQIGSMLKPKNIGSASSGNLVLNIPRSTSHVLYLVSASNVKNGIVLLSSTSTGDVSYAIAYMGSQLSVSASTDTLTIAITGSGNTIQAIDMPATLSSGYITKQ